MTVMLKGSRVGGAVLPLFAVAFVGILAVAGLGLDSGRLMLENTRLQNALDAASLSAAKTLGETGGNTAAGLAEARAAFVDNANNVGNRGTLEDYAMTQSTDLIVEFSNVLLPAFDTTSVTATSPARYVRLTAQNYSVSNFLIPLLGFDETTITNSSVSGPSPRLTRICNIAPMMVCGNPNAPDTQVGTDANGNPVYQNFYGYTPGEAVVMKSGPPGGGGSWEIGPGNFQLVRLPGNNGASDLRRALAGEYDACLDLNDNIPTEPGNQVGPVAQGLNTRFNQYQGGQVNATQYPPDVIVRQGDGQVAGSGNGNGNGNGNGGNGNGNSNGGGSSDRFEVDAAGVITFDGDTISMTNGDLSIGGFDIYDYTEYTADRQSSSWTNSPPTGKFFRRTLAIPVGNCSGTTNGQGTVPMLGALCFHLLQDVDQGGDPEVFGQIIGDGSGCGATGSPGQTPNDDTGPYRIQLYKDPARISS